jgi:hypothetical protein
LAEGPLIKVECYFSLSCCSEGDLRRNVREALLAEGLKAEVSFRRVGAAEARALGLKGSPTVRIDGSEVQPVPEMEGFG